MQTVTSLNKNIGVPIQITQDLQKFSLDLTRKLVIPNQNFIFSPFSVAVALAIAAGGAVGETQRQILDVLGYTDVKQLGIISQFLSDTQQRNKMLSIANMLVSNDNFGLKPLFIKFTEGMFDAQVVSKPFNEQTVGFINQWVKDSTHDMIPEIVDKLTPEDLLIILNAIYFHGQWVEKFMDAVGCPFYLNTQSKIKTLLPEIVNVPTMKKKFKSVMYAEVDKTQIIGIPYQDSSIEMFVCLPEDLDVFMTNLNQSVFQKLIGSMQSEEVTFQMPKWTIETNIEASLKDGLQALGIVGAFNQAEAKLDSISDAKSFISRVVHKAKIEIDEIGTKAAAATAMTMSIGCCLVQANQEIKMIVDRPFFYAMVDIINQTIIFTGVVVNPEI